MDDSVWTLEGEGADRLIRVELEKNEGDHWWPHVVEGEPEVDVSQIDPPPVNLDALEGGEDDGRFACVKVMGSTIRNRRSEAF